MKRASFQASVHLATDAPHKVEINFALHRDAHSWVTIWIGAHGLTIHGTADQAASILQGLTGTPHDLTNA